ncbi:hypothetical protein [uncultured Hymenobacter sp.]|uniref:hypothetical protein n=1 Tax=uncultured Hymenobacter sp. TaxID=170016 RepID=UPI0035CA2D89
MRSIKITDSETGQVYPGHLPTGWHEVPLSAFQAYARLQQQRRPELSLLSAVQALTALPADVLEADMSVAKVFADEMPWFFAGLPTGEPAAVLTHRSLVYEHCQDFGRLSGGQFEALLTFLDEADGNPAVAAPYLLAVLLKRRGTRQDARAVREAAEAFASLPMEVAWPYVMGFLRVWSTNAVRLQACSVAKLKTETALLQLLEGLHSAPKPAGRLRRLCSTTAAALAKRYVRSALGHLRNC